MGFGMSTPIYLLYSLFLLESLLQTTQGHLKNFEKIVSDEDRSNHLRLKVNQDGDNGVEPHDQSRAHRSADLELQDTNPELQVFFYHGDLKLGRKMRIYFPKRDLSTSPHLLSRQESDSIPFSSSQLPEILEFFEFHEASKQALAMRTTLEHCEFPPMKGEKKFCATSLESMLDSLGRVFGTGSKFRVVTTDYLSGPTSLLQNYTVSEVPREISAPRIMACHTLPYPYAVFYCHSQVRDNKLYQVALTGDDGATKVEAAAICHMDTSEWDPSHAAFRVLKVGPGESPVCHFFPPDNLVWIQTTS